MFRNKLYVLVRLTINFVKNIRNILRGGATQYSDEESIDILISSKKGLVRFGNSELRLITGQSVRTQAFDLQLSNKLREIASNGHTSRSLVALPVDMVNGSMLVKRGANPKMWLGLPRYSFYGVYSHNSTYLSPFIFRMKEYTPFTEVDKHIEKVKEFFSGKRILYAGPSPASTQLFDTAVYVQTPPKNAYSDIINLKREIVETYQQENIDCVLLTIGATGTVLSYELNANGVLTYDFGQGLRHFEEVVNTR